MAPKVLRTTSQRQFRKQIKKSCETRYRYAGIKATNENFRSYSGFRDLDALEKYIRVLAKRKRYRIRDFNLTWHMSTHTPLKECDGPRGYLSLLNWTVGPKQALPDQSVLLKANPVLVRKIRLVIDWLIKASIVNRSKGAKTNANYLESIVLTAISAPKTRRNCELIRICMHSKRLPACIYTGLWLYRGVSLDISRLAELARGASSSLVDEK